MTRNQPPSPRCRTTIDPKDFPLVTLYHRHFPAALHTRLRVLAAQRGSTMEDVVTACVTMALPKLEQLAGVNGRQEKTR